MKRSRRVVLTLMGTAASAPSRRDSCARGRLRPRQSRCPARDGRTHCRVDHGGFGGSRSRVHGHGHGMAATAMAAAHGAASAVMQRIACPERDDWRATAEAAGFDFHTIDGERYWDERAYYAFTLEEIEREIEAPTGEIDAMCLELVARASTTSASASG